MTQLRDILAGGLFAAVLAVGLPACTGGSGDQVEAPSPDNMAIPLDMLEETWPVVTGDNEVRQPYEANRGWIDLVVKRDVRAAVEKLGPEGGTAAARAHAEAAAMYRQAAMLSAHSLIAAWAGMAEDTDPAGGAHLVAVSYALAGDLDQARAWSGRLEGVEGPAQAWHAPWKAWLGGEAAWPPDLSGLPTELPPVEPGTWPGGGDLPHYELTERTDDGRTVEASDPSELVALALWHEQAARAAVEDDALVDLFLVQYRFPVEPHVAADTELPLDFVFGSDYLVAEDANFLAALQAWDEAPDAHDDPVPEFADQSWLAALARLSRVDGKIDPEQAVDLAAETRRAILATLEEKAGGNREGFHRTFADIARVAVLRGLALVAEAEGDREVSGRLRILALESSGEEWTADASALLAMAAWDASNEYPVRATETLHNLIRRYPSLETARFGVDVLSLRVSRRRGGGLPGQ